MAAGGLEALASLAPSFSDFNFLEWLGGARATRVLRVRHAQLEREVALKLLLPGGEAAAFIQEARLLAALHTVEWPRLLDFGRRDEIYFYTMDLMAGHSLARTIEMEGPPSGPQVLDIAEAVLDSLQELHARGYRHGDLAARHIMLPYGYDFGRVRPHPLMPREPFCRLLDLGRARGLDARAGGERDLAALADVLSACVPSVGAAQGGLDVLWRRLRGEDAKAARPHVALALRWVREVRGGWSARLRASEVPELPAAVRKAVPAARPAPASKSERRVRGKPAHRPVVPPAAVKTRERVPLQPGSDWGPFRIVSVLGRGGMGVVYRALHRGQGVEVALKLIKPETEAEAVHQERLLQEAEHTRTLDHPQIVRVLDVGRIEGQAFLAMEYIAGETLAQRLERGPLPRRQALEILAGVVRGLAYAHEQGIVHRDIKPGNIMLSTYTARYGLTLEGDSDLLVRITDFGLARKVGQAAEAGGDEFGTAKYLSPEQIQGAFVAGRSDIFSLGIVAYEMFTGREPFVVESAVGYLHANVYEQPVPPEQLVPDLPSALSAVILAMLAKSVTERYSAGALILDLEDLDEEGRGDLAKMRIPRAEPSAGVGGAALGRLTGVFKRVLGGGKGKDKRGGKEG